MNKLIDAIQVEKDIPDIFCTNPYNPTLYSPNNPFIITFSQTRETLTDVDNYRNFLYSAISMVRTSNFYKSYKGYLIHMGLNRCQLHPNIIAGEDDVATLEMHHLGLTIYDMAMIITEHIINTYGCLTSFDLAELLRIEHEEHRLCVCMLCKTCHQLYHSNNDFKIPMSMGFGKWWEFLEKYRYGITKEIANKIYFQLKQELYNTDKRDEKILNMLKVRDNILQWSDYNDTFFKK